MAVEVHRDLDRVMTELILPRRRATRRAGSGARPRCAGGHGSGSDGAPPFRFVTTHGARSTALNGGLGLEKRFAPLERSRERGGAQWSPKTSPWRIPVHAANAIRSSHSGYHRLQAPRRVASSASVSGVIAGRASYCARA